MSEYFQKIFEKVIFLFGWILSFFCSAMIANFMIFGYSPIDKIVIDEESLVIFWRTAKFIGILTIIPAILTSIFVEIYIKKRLVLPYSIAGIITGLFYFFLFEFDKIKEDSFIYFIASGAAGGLVFGLLRSYVFRRPRNPEPS